MSVTHEIVTIQSGKNANFIGTHWWNIQESSFCYSPNDSAVQDINHDVTFREGLNFRRETTYTPRLVVVDLQDNFRSLRKESSLYRTDDKATTSLWDGPVEVIKEESVRINRFLEQPQNSGETEGTSTIDASEFDCPSTSWSDYLRTHLHPNSLCLLNEASSSDDIEALGLYSNGEEVYDQNGEAIEESIRKMTEECDYLQGFQFIYDAYNGFSGVSNKILQLIDDEYKRRPTLCFPVYQDVDFPVQNVKKQMHRLYAILLSISNMSSYSTLFSPLSLTDDVVKLSYPYKKFPYLHYNEKLLYHTSAIFAAAIETLSSPFRLKSMKYNMFDATASLATYGRKLVCSSISLPFPLSKDAYLNAMIEKEVPEYYMKSLSPFYKPDSERTLFQSAVLRGVPTNKLTKLEKSHYNSVIPEEVFGEYLNKYSPSSVVTATVFEEKCSVCCPFPKIFKDSAKEHGFLSVVPDANQKGVEKVSMAASFSNSDSSSQFLEDLLSQANKVSFKEYVKNAETTFEKDIYREVIENVIGLQDNYTNY